MLTRTVGTIALAMGCVALLGCTSKTQLRIIATQTTPRAGRYAAAAIVDLDTTPPTLTHHFTGSAATGVNFLFGFHASGDWRFLTDVSTTFTPDTLQPNECAFDCHLYMSLRPGHQYSLRIPIITDPRMCPAPGEDEHAAADVCAELNRGVRLANCQFVVTSARRCDLVCFGEPPEDDNRDQGESASVDAGDPGSGTPPIEPAVIDASASDATDSGPDATGIPMDAATDVPSSVPPIVCGGFANDCDGRVGNDTCPAGWACSGGRCVTACVESACPSGSTCQAGGACIENACLGVTCPAGQVCVSGGCVDPCAM